MIWKVQFNQAKELKQIVDNVLGLVMFRNGTGPYMALRTETLKGFLIMYREDLLRFMYYVDKKQLIDILLMDMDIKSRYHWCESESGCACTGCANVGGLNKYGYQKEEWEEWVKENPRLEEGEAGD